MKAKSALLFLFLFVNLHCLSLRSDPGAKIVGDWEGLADGQSEFSMTIGREDGEFTGFVNIPGMSVYQGPLTGLTFEDDKLTGFFDLGGGTELVFTGVIQEDGSVSGSYDAGGDYGTFVMGRIEG